MNAIASGILFVAGPIRLRSGYLHMLDLLDGLAASGAGASLLYGDIPRDFIARRIRHPMYPWADLHPSLLFGDPAALARLCDRRRIDLIHVHGVGLSRGAERSLRHAGRPIVFTPHGIESGSGQIRRLNRLARRVIALSEFRREALVNDCRIARDKIRVTPPGLDLNEFPPRLPEIGATVPVVGTVAPLEPGRGQDVFLEAARRVLASGREVAFVVAGDGSSEASLRRQAARLGIAAKVTFVCRLQSYRSAIAALDVFVRAAVTGGLGYTVLEAMAMGKLVIASATGDIPEMIAEGRTGLMAPKGDAEALAAMILNALSDTDRARQIGLAARAGVAERFTMERLVRQTLDVYAEAAAELKSSQERT